MIRVHLLVYGLKRHGAVGESRLGVMIFGTEQGGRTVAWFTWVSFKLTSSLQALMIHRYMHTA